MKEASIEQQPKFYTAPTLPTHIERLGVGALIDDTILGVIFTYRGSITLGGSFEEIITVTHNAGKIYEPFIRIKTNSGEWQSLPSTHQLDGTLGGTVYCELTDITKDTIILTFWNSYLMDLTGECAIEIYFIDFTV